MSARGAARYGNQGFFQSAGDCGPVVLLDNERTSGGFELTPSPDIAKQADDAAREARWIVGEQQVLAVSDREPFGSDRRRHDGFAHGHRFEDFQPRAAADAQRHHVHRRIGDVWPHVVDAAGHVYPLFAG